MGVIRNEAKPQVFPVPPIKLLQEEKGDDPDKETFSEKLSHVCYIFIRLVYIIFKGCV